MKQSLYSIERRNNRLAVRYEICMPAWSNASAVVCWVDAFPYKTVVPRVQQAYWQVVEDCANGEPTAVQIYFVIHLHLFGWEYRVRKLV